MEELKLLLSCLSKEELSKIIEKVRKIDEIENSDTYCSLLFALYQETNDRAFKENPNLFETNRKK